jgi:hypothetical protein
MDEEGLHMKERQMSSFVVSLPHLITHYTDQSNGMGNSDLKGLNIILT